MKKQFLPLILAIGLTSLAFAQQNTYVVGNAKIKVNSNTLFYHGGSFNITDKVTDPQVVTNAGNIKIQGTFVNEGVFMGNPALNHQLFVNTWSSDNSYGQVIINQGSTLAQTSRLTMQKNSIDPQVFSWGQFSVPYKFGTNTANEVMQGLFGKPLADASRRYSSMMRWDNLDKPEFDHLKKTDIISPTDYIILNLTAYSPGILEEMELEDVMNYPGVPANGEHEVSYVPAVYPKSSEKPWDVWKNEKNTHGEKYITYIDDPVRQANGGGGVSNPNYGRYIFQFGNPYTSNIDLSYIGLDDVNYKDDGVYIQELQGVTKYTKAEWTNDETIREIEAHTATFNGTNWAGDKDALIIKPFEPFTITLDVNRVEEEADLLTPRKIKFSDKLKTFAMEPSMMVTPYPTGGKMNHGATFGDFVANNNTNSTPMGMDGGEGGGMQMGDTDYIAHMRLPFYQLELGLFTENDENTGKKVYVAVDTSTNVGVLSPLEAQYYGFSSGLFTMQENVQGTPATEVSSIMQINAIPHLYVGKPIPLGMKFAPNETNGYFVKANLYYKDIFSKLGPEEGNFPDGNSFFFYDRVQDVLLPINTDFTYYIERSEENVDLRYEVYWNGGPDYNPGRMSIEEDSSIASTVVYKDGDVHKIRFNKNWKTAEVKVYDLSGRLIFVKQNVNVLNGDFALNLPKVSTFVVKVQSETGEVYTQKIIR